MYLLTAFIQFPIPDTLPLIITNLFYFSMSLFVCMFGFEVWLTLFYFSMSWYVFLYVFFFFVWLLCKFNYMVVFLFNTNHCLHGFFVSLIDLQHNGSSYYTTQWLFSIHHVISNTHFCIFENNHCDKPNHDMSPQRYYLVIDYIPLLYILYWFIH